MNHAYLTTIFLFVILFSCDNRDVPLLKGEPCKGQIADAEPTGDNTTLVWADEFETDGVPCSDNWTYDVDTGTTGSSGWGNQEVQYYTRETDNVEVKGGVLKITAKKQNYSGASYTSARVKTQGLYGFTYGKVIVKAKLPAGGGTWPAIWMLGENITEAGIGWPACGEIDIMEHTGNKLGVTSSAIHNSSGSKDNPAFVKHHDKIDDVANAFHEYGIIWTENKIDFTIDGEVKGTYTKPVNSTTANWPFFENQFIILNVAMGGALGGNIDPDFTESSMEIDYVRVYQ